MIIVWKRERLFVYRLNRYVYSCIHYEDVPICISILIQAYDRQMDMPIRMCQRGIHIHTYTWKYIQLYTYTRYLLSIAINNIIILLPNDYIYVIYIFIYRVNVDWLTIYLYLLNI